MGDEDVEVGWGPWVGMLPGVGPLGGARAGWGWDGGEWGVSGDGMGWGGAPGWGRYYL